MGQKCPFSFFGFSENRVAMPFYTVDKALTSCYSDNKIMGLFLFKNTISCVFGKKTLDFPKIVMYNKFCMQLITILN